MELCERGKTRFKRQMTHVVVFHETKQKLFRYARAKDKRVVDLRKELKSLNKEGETLTKEKKTRFDDLTKKLESGIDFFECQGESTKEEISHEPSLFSNTPMCLLILGAYLRYFYYLILMLPLLACATITFLCIILI